MPQSNFWIDLIASLNKKKSKDQIKNDVQNLGDIKFPLIGTLSKAKTKAQIAKDLSSLNASTELKVKVDSKKVANNVQLATQQAQKQVKPIQVNFDVKKEKLINDIKVLAKTNSAMFKDVDVTSKYNALLDSAKFANTSKELRSVRLQLSALRSELKATNLAGLNLTDTLKKGVRRAGEVFGSYGLIMAAIRQLRNAWTEALTLDKTYTDLNKVQNELSRSDYPKYLDDCNKKAKDLATSQKELIEGTTEFSKSGYNLSTSQQLTDKSTVLSNVGEMTASDSAKAIISGVQAYDDIDGFTDVIDKAQSLIDKYNEIGNTASITTAEIAKGVQAVGSVFADANTDVNEFIALLAAGNRQFQDADSLSLGLRTSALRIRGATAELEAMGEETDGVITSTSKLAEKIQALTNINGSGGVHILEDDEKTFRSIYDIYVDIGNVYQQMSDVDQSSLLDLIAGKHRASGVSATLNNMAEAQEIYKSSLNSSGSAQKEYETYLESSEAALNRFKASMTETYQSVIDGETVKGLLNCGRASLDFANNLGLVESSLKDIVAIGAVKAITMLSAAFHNSAIRANNFGIALNTIRDMSAMTKGTVAYTNALNVLKNVSLNLSEAQLRQVLASKALNDVDRIAILRTTGLTKAQAQAKLAQIGLTQSTNAQAVANTAATTSTFSLTAAVSGFGMTLKGIFLSNPLGISIMALSMIIGVVSSKMKENAEKANESKQAFNELTSEISSINDELKTASDRLKELNAIGYDNLSLVEKEEYDRLVSTNDELERELRIKQALADVAGKEAATDASNALGKKSENSISQVNTYGSGSQTAVKVDRLDYLGENIDFAEQQRQALDRAKQALNEYETAFAGTNDELVKDSKWKQLNSNVNSITDTITNTEKVISDTYADIETDSEGLLDSTGKVITGYEDMYNRVQSIKDRLDGYFNPEPKVTNLDSLNKLFGKDKVSSLSDKQLEVAYSIRNVGDLTWDELREKLKEVDKERKTAEKPITIQMAISNIETLSTGLDKINAIREDIKDKGDFDFGSLVDEDFVAQFGGLGETYQNFIDTVANSPTDLKACQSAFDDLTTAYLYQNDALNSVTDETYDATVAMLKQKGVANATEVATMALVKSKIDAFIAGKDLKDMTDAEITAFLHENGVIDVTNSMLEALRLAKLTVNGTELDFSSDIDSIIAYVDKLGGATVALKVMADMKKELANGTLVPAANPFDFTKNMTVPNDARTKALQSSSGSNFADIMSNAQKEVQSAMNSVMDIKVDYKGYTPKKSSSSSSKTEKYTAEIDAYAKLKAELDKIQSDISANQKKYDNTDSEREKIALLQQRITLTQKEQSALHNLNNARDKEIGNNVELLKQKGFLVSYNPDSNELEISNLEHLNELKGKDQEATNDLIKEYEDLINTTQSLNEENRDSSNSWWDSYYSLSEYKDEIKDLNQQIFDNEVDNQEHLLELLEQRSGTEKEQILLLKEMQENALRQRQKLEDEDYVANIKKIRDLENAWTSYYDKILEAQKKQLENQKEILELEKSNMDSAISAATSVLDDEISSLQEELDALSDANDERERKLKLQELEANLEKAKSQKTAYIYRDGAGFGYEVDQSAVDEAQNAIDDYKSEQKLKAKQDALQAEIDSLQKYKEKWEEISNAVTEQENKQNAAMLLGSNWKNKLINQDTGVLNDFKNDYVDVEESINEKTKDIETITTELANHLDTEFTRIIKSFEDMTKAISGAFGISVTEVADEENTPKSASETKQKSSTSFWDKIVGKVTSVFDLLTNGTSTNTDSLDENNSNLKTSSTTQKTNTDTVKDNTTNVKSNSSYVDTNSNKVSDNSSSVDTNSGNLETLNDTLITSTSKIVGAAETVATAKKSKDDDDDSGSSSSSSSSSSKSSGGSIISKVVGGISKVISSLTKHHSGGIIGDTDDKGKALFELAKQPLKADEEVSILQYGELVLTEEQQANIVARLNEMTSYDNMLSSALSSAFGNSGYVPSNLSVPSITSDYSVVGNTTQDARIIQHNTINVDFSDIQEVKQIQEAILTLPQYVAQKSTSGYKR